MSERAGPGLVAQALIVLAAYVALEIVLVTCAILCVFVYSTLIHPGEDATHYEEYAQMASPVVAAVLAGPVFFPIARYLRRRWPKRALRFVAATCVLAIAVSGALIVALDTDDVGTQFAFAALVAAAIGIGGYFGARPTA